MKQGLPGSQNMQSYLRSEREKETTRRSRSQLVKSALIVGISDYKNISDLSYCDEDATNWHDYLRLRGYDCKILGDKHVSNYPRYDGLATENNVRSIFRDMLATSDVVSFATSGHGASDSVQQERSYLCMYDAGNGQNDKYYDYELLEDIKGAGNRVKIFIFIDHCFSGGMLDELKRLPNVVCTSTCGPGGYGYDTALTRSGAWTECFLNKGLRRVFLNREHNMSEVFRWAKANYRIFSQADAPMIVVGRAMKSFSL